MTHETSKAYRRRFSREPVYADIFKGTGIDIGGGGDPLKAEWFPQAKSVRNFDLIFNDGDAQNITDYVKEQYDFVYSSNCLEHTEQPRNVLKEWWSLVKPGGHLVLIVPDEDLYEQGVWPSWTGEHKWTFTVWKKQSWSPKSINVMELWRGLPDCQLVHVKMADSGWDVRFRGLDQTWPPDGAEAFIELVLRKQRGDEVMDTVDKLADLYSLTDKKRQGFTPLYDMLFAPFKLSVTKVLEIGIHRGDSLRMWRDFFPNATIYGWDKDPQFVFQEPRIKTRAVDHDDKEQVRLALDEIGGNMNIVIEDGSHWMSSQQRLLAWCLPYVGSGGLYVTEDLHTSTIPGQFGLKDDKSNSTYRMFVGLQSNGVVESEYLTDEEKTYIQGVAGRVLLFGSPAKVHASYHTSMLSALFKK
jgi:trans-aconitate methyltransferase